MPTMDEKLKATAEFIKQEIEKRERMESNDKRNPIPIEGELLRVEQTPEFKTWNSKLIVTLTGIAGAVILGALHVVSGGLALAFIGGLVGGYGSYRHIQKRKGKKVDNQKPIADN